MKYFGMTPFYKVVSGATLLAALMVFPAQAQQQGKAQVTAVRGIADYTRDGVVWKPLNTNQTLQPGDSIRTGLDSTVDLHLGANGPSVLVTPTTTLGIDRLLYEQAGSETIIETQLDLRSGRILGNVRKLAKASKYEVKVPNGVVGIRGTKYDISVDGLVHVIEGSAVVVFVDAQGETQTFVVEGGNTFVPQTMSVEPTSPSLQNQLQVQVSNIQTGPGLAEEELELPTIEVKVDVSPLTGLVEDRPVNNNE